MQLPPDHPLLYMRFLQGQYCSYLGSHSCFSNGQLVLNRCVFPHCTENLKHIFPEVKLCGVFPNFYIPVSVSDLYISTISPQQTNRENIEIAHRYMNETEHYNSVLEITRPCSFISGNT